MPPKLISPSGEQHNTLESKMEPIAGISFPSRPDGGGAFSQDLKASENLNRNPETTVQKFVVCPKMVKRLLRKTSSSSAEPSAGT
jgi:hypothetical protein